MKPRKITKPAANPPATNGPARLLAPVRTETPKGTRTRLGMTANTKQGAEPEKWVFEGRIDEEPDEAMARLRTAPAYNAGEVIYAYNGTSHETMRGLVNELDRQTRAVHGGDLSQLESMLTAQAHTLDAIFTRLAKRAHANMGAHLGAAETYLRLALKAQSQCRSTVEALGELKNPASVAFVKQANISAGHQQINNGTTRAGETEIPPSKLLEATDGERLDAGAASTSSGADKDLAAVGEINGSEVPGRKGKGRKERR